MQPDGRNPISRRIARYDFESAVVIGVPRESRIRTK